jgi:hypothetical protein
MKTQTPVVFYDYEQKVASDNSVFTRGPAFKAQAPRRRRLWDLPHECHCPLIGVCLPLERLRSLVDKALHLQTSADDYQVHVAAVSECTRRTRMSNALQRELERRYLTAVRRFAAADSAEALSRFWHQAVAEGEVAGALWAGLTHPCCNVSVQEAICRDIHMIQHQAGERVRVDVARVRVLEKQLTASRAEFAKEQERGRRMQADRDTEIARLKATLMGRHANAIAKDTMIQSLQARLAEFETMVPALEARVRLKERNAELAAHQAQLKLEIVELKRQLDEALKRLDAASRPAKTDHVDSEEGVWEVRGIRSLEEKTVLCVGGRTANVANYRAFIERIGGRFAHHDGGLEHNTSLLDTSLAAADLVICQAGCISHNAYWRVKDFCKRTGKQCVFVETPSVSGLARALTQERITKEAPVPVPSAR